MENEGMEVSLREAKKMNIEDMPTEALLAEKSRIAECGSRVKDTLSQMLLVGRLKAIYRELEKRDSSKPHAVDYPPTPYRLKE